MLVGQERAGKTSLKNSLLGLPFNPDQESTVGVEVDPSCCSVDVDNVKNWQRTTDSTQTDFADNIARLIADDLKHADDEEARKEEEDVKQENVEDVEDGGKNDETTQQVLLTAWFLSCLLASLSALNSLLGCLLACFSLLWFLVCFLPCFIVLTCLIFLV